MLGGRIRKLREAANLTQADLADKLGVTQAYIAMLESDAREPSLDVLRRLAKALKADVSELLK
jgi:transcriptional regulator with XRE-family HTH domain